MAAALSLARVVDRLNGAGRSNTLELTANALLVLGIRGNPFLWSSDVWSFRFIGKYS